MTADAVSIKVPIFSETATAGWFSILESQFHLRSISVDETKFYHVISALPAELISKLPSALMTNKSYNDLKNAVISIHEKTKPELFARLINDTKMTGRPSYYLQELTATANKIGIKEEDLIKHRFIKALPDTISPVIAAQKSLTLEQMGTLADELMPLLQKENFAVSQNTKTDLTYHQPPNTPKPNYSNQPIGLRPFSKDQRPRVCRGHLYFAEKSRTCKPWCRWPNKQHCTMQPNSRAPSPSREPQQQEN